jgi:heme/copper-type cytochrome/quinol oxidase subunit 3
MPDRTKLGMILFVLSESVFFLLLIISYAFYNLFSGKDVAAASSLDPIKTGVFSVALFSSSATMWRAGVSARKRRHASVGLWLLITIVLGAVFLIGQGMEYYGLLQKHVTISRNVFGTTFFTVTSFHGLHVFVGLSLLAILFGLAVGGKAHEPTVPTLDVISIYWHFVDAVWVVIFSVIYVWGVLI